MSFKTAQSAGDAFSSIGNSISNLTAGLFGGATSSSGNSTVTSDASGKRESQLQLSQEAINKLIQDVLGADGGIADIFSNEKALGLYDTTTAQKQSGELMAAIVGELAKLTGKQVTSEESGGTQKQESSTSSKTSGLFDFLGL